MNNIEKNKLENVDKIFEKSIWIDKNYEYNPLYRYKKFYIISKDGNIKRYGVNKIVGTNVVNRANFILFSKKAGKFKIENVKFHHGTNFINKFDPFFFFFDREKNKYVHLKYNQIYNEDDIDDLYSYSYNDELKTLNIMENDKVIRKIDNVHYYEFSEKKPTWMIYSVKSLSDNYYNYYEYDFILNEGIFIGKSEEDRFYNNRYKIYDCLKKVKKSQVLYDKKQVYFYISESESDGFKILYNYIKENGTLDNIENEFSDDTTVNYKIACDINDKKNLQFIYWIIKNKDVKGFSIYNYPIKEIVKILDYNIDINKNFNKLFIENYSDKQMIIKKLKEKYFMNSDEDLIVRLANKYGKELLLPVEGIDQNSQEYHDIFFEKADSIKYENIYSQLINDGIIVNRWKSERNLFKLIKTYFEDAIYQYHAKFLGRQSIDIFIPSLSIGIEYQGKQHYEAIDFFGGEERLEEQFKRDSKKKELCRENNIILVEWGYYEDINKDVLEQKLKKINASTETLKNKIGIII